MLKVELVGMDSNQMNLQTKVLIELRKPLKLIS
jgi:hypothetical protein